MEDKVYYFDFGSEKKKKISYVFGMIIFLFLSFCLDVFIFFGFMYLSDTFQNKELYRCLFYIIISLAFVFKICGIIVQFFPRKIILTDDRIKIKYNNFCWFSLKIFSLEIKYKKLNSCELNHYSKIMFMGKGFVKIPFVALNWNSLVILRKKFRVFAIPVENAEDFVSEVEKRIKLSNCTKES